MLPRASLDAASRLRYMRTMTAEAHAPQSAKDAEAGGADAAPADRRFWPTFGFALAAGVVALDQLTKWIILGPLAFSPSECRELRVGCGVIDILPFFDLTMVWNRGVSFGLFQAETGFGRWALVAFSLVVAVWLGFWLARQVRRPLTAVALGLVIGGAIGNMIDRARFGAVVDFLDFSGLGFPWVFNVADAAINVGAAFLVLQILLDRRMTKGLPE
jgi:signal peptidase II